YRLQRCSPHTGYHIYHKGKYDDRQDCTWNRKVSHWTIVRKAYLADKVQSHKPKDHYPQCKENLPIQPVPMISQVDGGKQLECQCKIQKTQYHVNTIQPATRHGQRFQDGREKSKEDERYGQGNREA